MLSAFALALPLIAAVPAAPTLQSILTDRNTAVATLHTRDPKTLEIAGTVDGAALHGNFHSWRAGENERYEEITGVRLQSTYRLGGREYIVNENGIVRELRGLLLARQRTEDFIENDNFVSEPQYDRFLGAQELPGGRDVYAISVAPPQGQPETVYLDRATSMIDRVAYDDADGEATVDYYDYAVLDRVLVAKRTVESNGDHAFDLTRRTTDVTANQPIGADYFALPPSTVVQTDRPITVPLEVNNDHYYVRVRIAQHDYRFLLDSGAQAIVLDGQVAEQAGLHPEGQLEVAGAQRTGGLGVAALDSVQIGTATLPVHMVTVLNLHGVTGAQAIDGILGYPFFASTEARIDPDAQTLTFGKPGTLTGTGTVFSIDGDRELVELQAKVDGADGRFVVDTGNANELLIYGPFLRAHQGLISYAGGHFAGNSGVGGSAQAVAALVDQLDLGPYHFYNRYANVMLSTEGAFADRFDAGNIGMGVLRNFVLTFDLQNGRLYAKPAAHYDDGRYRGRTE